MQLAPTLRVAGQFVESKLQPGPVTVGGSVTLTGPTPVFCRVMLAAADWPTCTVNTAGVLRLACGPATVADTGCVSVPALVAQLNVVVAVPALANVCDRVTVQLAPGARAAPQVCVGAPNTVPVTAGGLTKLKLASPVLDNVAVQAALTPTYGEPQSKELNAGPAAGGGVTLADKATLRVAEAPECVTVKVAALAPRTVGV